MIECSPGKVDTVVVHVPVLFVEPQFFRLFTEFLQFFILLFAYFNRSGIGRVMVFLSV